MEWRFIQPDQIDVVRVAKQIIDVFYDGFQISRPADPSTKGWSITDAAAMVRRCTYVSVLSDPGRPEDISGYACYVCPSATVLDGFHMLWEDGICMRLALQGRGLGGQARASAIRHATNAGRSIGFIGGRTQNPVVMIAYAQNSAFCYPFETAYDQGDGRTVSTFLTTHIDEAKNETFDPATGIFTRVYKEGRLGRYVIPTNRPNVAEWEDWLAKKGFDRDQGDAVAIVGRLATALGEMQGST